MNSNRSDERMDVRETCAFFGGSEKPLHPASLYRGVKLGYYPRPVRIGPGSSRWLRSECEAALLKMIAKRDTTAA
jgi:predicted DNA-binding transcriptional regulator AlpA